MKFSHRGHKVGQVLRQEINAIEAGELATLPEHAFPGQRDHATGFKRKPFLRGVLQGLTQTFSAVYIIELKRLELIDGYHRGYGVSIGEIMAHPDFPYYLDTYTVVDRPAANKLFEQFNSLSAAKKSTCWFESGLNECGLLNTFTSSLVMGQGKATAVQYAAGKKGSANTKQATIDVIEGLKVVESFQLERHSHEFGGSIAVYYAAAVHCKDLSLVETFVRAINGVVLDGSVKTPATDILGVYHKMLKGNDKKTGGTPSEAVFRQGLAAFARFAYTQRRKGRVPRELTMDLARFKDLMQAL